MVQTSSSFAHFRTLVKELRLTPRGMGRSQRYFLKPDASRLTATSATWELSIAWRFCIRMIKKRLAVSMGETYNSLLVTLEIGISHELFDG